MKYIPLLAFGTILLAGIIDAKASNQVDRDVGNPGDQNTGSSSSNGQDSGSDNQGASNDDDNNLGLPSGILNHGQGNNSTESKGSKRGLLGLMSMPKNETKSSAASTASIFGGIFNSGDGSEEVIGGEESASAQMSSDSFSSSGDGNDENGDVSGSGFLSGGASLNSLFSGFNMDF